MAILEVDHLTKDYGSGRGVFDISFSISKGECYGFLGPNGAGKSTTIRHIMGYSKPDIGECRLFGEECFSHSDKILKSVGYIPGEIALPSGLDGEEFLDMMGKMKGNEDKKRLQDLLDYFALDEASLKIPTKRLSLGLKRKLAVVEAFASDPEVLVLDEPTSGLDLLMQQKFIDLIKKSKEEGKTILLSSHIFSEVDACCDRIGIIKDGKIISEFVADSLRHNDRKKYRIHFASVSEYQRFNQENEKISFATILERHDYSNVVILSCLDEDCNKLIEMLAHYQIVSFSSSRESLEDYFMKFYKENKDF